MNGRDETMKSMSKYRYVSELDRVSKHPFKWVNIADFRPLEKNGVLVDGRHRLRQIVDRREASKK